MVELNDVTIRKGGRALVRGLDLVIRPGSVFWVVGANGAGKSSLLRVLALLDPPAEGYVRREARERYLYFHPRITPSPRSTVGSWARLTERLLPAGSRTEHTPLWPDVPPARPIHRLSTGERKRLLLDALLRRSGPLILDEPYEHLSPDGKAALTRLLHERAAGAVVVVATNQATERAGQWGGLRLADGHAQRIGPRQEVVS